MNKRFALLTLLLVFPLILAACGGSDMDPADAEKGMEAAFTGNVEEAKKYFCDEEIEALQGSTAQLQSVQDMNMTVDATCSKDGSAMKCDYKLMAAMTEGAEPTELMSDSVRFNIRDGKLCGEAN